MLIMQALSGRGMELENLSDSDDTQCSQRCSRTGVSGEGYGSCRNSHAFSDRLFVHPGPGEWF